MIISRNKRGFKKDKVILWPMDAVIFYKKGIYFGSKPITVLSMSKFVHIFGFAPIKGKRYEVKTTVEAKIQRVNNE
jgi:hypothetical protein